MSFFQGILNFTGSLPWWARVGGLLSGIFVPVLGTILVLLDGIFHATLTAPDLPVKSPDWIIARNLFGGDGLSLKTHWVMGASLIAISLHTLWTFMTGKSTALSKLFLNLIMPITLIIIAIAVGLKAFYGKRG